MKYFLDLLLRIAAESIKQSYLTFHDSRAAQLPNPALRYVVLLGKHIMVKAIEFRFNMGVSDGPNNGFGFRDIDRLTAYFLSKSVEALNSNGLRDLPPCTIFQHSDRQFLYKLVHLCTPFPLIGGTVHLCQQLPQDAEHLPHCHRFPEPRFPHLRGVYDPGLRQPL